MAIASIRPAAVSGQFYPADERVLRLQVSDLMATAVPLEKVPPPKAIIVPHAGYIYSGSVAAAAYGALLPVRDEIRRVVILGPNHRLPVNGFALPAAQVFATPMGSLPLDRARWALLQCRPDVVVDDRPHAYEHCVEVQLPFLQSVFDRFTILPILVGEASTDAVAEVIEAVWGDSETLIVISSDLSHFHSYHQAQRQDRATVNEILAMRPVLDHEQACGATPVNGLLRVAARHGLVPHLLDLRNSGDTAGDRDRVVGYASIAFCDMVPHASQHH
ncbi:AmmeMemoRadiSam system protein B [Azoarcus sp. L1K30]|uniref:AmmeMemoRadiSam system protein B n=1 Tax=Azoarcus sp. L1K30 TaxID=2820277 RepID=UPI001B82157F|nr:AmmeMemoRadiSam system protein B [Azoarcus sp. L1K30]MBR0565262.1 AmmeMemoRadiSam system protein B [Azoarcus sp. L1K30]